MVYAQSSWPIWNIKILKYHFILSQPTSTTAKCNSIHSYIQTAAMLSCCFMFIDVDHRKVSECYIQSHGQAIHTTASKLVWQNTPEWARRKQHNFHNRLQSFGMLHSVNQQIVTNVLRDFNAFNFRVKQSKNTAVTSLCFKTDKDFSSAVELHLSGFIGTVSHPDMQKIWVIWFDFENKLHWQFEGRLLQFTACTWVYKPFHHARFGVLEAITLYCTWSNSQ